MHSRTHSGARSTPGSVALALTLAISMHAAGAEAAEPGRPALPDERWRAAQTGTLSADRLQHASLTLTLGLGTGVVSRSPALAFASGVTWGVAKELFDARSGSLSWGDLVADLAGACLATMATRALDR